MFEFFHFYLILCISFMITLIQPVSFDGFLPPYAFLRLWSDEQFDPVSTLFPIGCEVPDRAATSAFHFEVVTTPFQSLFRPELYDTRESLMFIDISSFTSHFQISELPWCESKWSGKSQCSFLVSCLIFGSIFTPWL